MMIGLEPLSLGNDLGVESGFVESPFWYSYVECRFTVPGLRTQLSQGCNGERLKRDIMGPTAQSSPPR